MSNEFDKWKDQFKNNGTSAIVGLKDVFNDVDYNPLLILKLELVNTTGFEKEHIERKIALRTEYQKASSVVLPELTDDARKDAIQTRTNLEKALKDLKDYLHGQQGEVNLLEEDPRKEDITDLEKEIKKEEDKIRVYLKELQNIGNEVTGIDGEIKTKKKKKVEEEAEFKDTTTIEEDIKNKIVERKKKFITFEDLQEKFNFSILDNKLSSMKDKKEKKAELEMIVTRSKVIIDFISENITGIAATLAHRNHLDSASSKKDTGEKRSR